MSPFTASFNSIWWLVGLLIVAIVMKYIDMDATMKKLIYLVIGVAALIWVLNYVGISL